MCEKLGVLGSGLKKLLMLKCQIFKANCSLTHKSTTIGTIVVALKSSILCKIGILVKAIQYQQSQICELMANLLDNFDF